MDEVVIYHNPRCSTSRKTLELLRSRGVEPTVIEYLKTPPDEATLTRIVEMLGIEPIDLVRKKETEFAALGLAAKSSDRKEIIRQMAGHPILIQRPIVVKGTKARLGRPPESVLEIL